jgi:hypothetical protein
MKSMEINETPYHSFAAYKIPSFFEAYNPLLWDSPFKRAVSLNQLTDVNPSTLYKNNPSPEILSLDF